VASWSRSPDPFGRIWCARFFSVLTALLRWQEEWLGRRLKGGISNKADLPSFWRLCISALLRSAWCSSELFVVMSSRWRCDAGRSGGVFFNKREFILLWNWSLLFLLPLPTRHGGCGDEVVVAVCCSKGGDGGEIELIQADGITAMAIYRQQGGGTATSVLEALDISTAEARRSLAIKWYSPQWLGDGSWQRFLAEREPTSCLFLFLGGDAWRTPAFGSGGTPVLDCFGSIRCRVFFTICKPLSSNTRFVRASVVRDLLQMCTRHY
jgi:hypothetical protein